MRAGTLPDGLSEGHRWGCAVRPGDDPGEQAQSFDDKVDVVLTDASAVRVRVNGAEHPPGKVGERQEFTVPRE
nr:hypothetical protein GCM10020093_079650 [Planobispora longispora]